jgi:hypothetical protein
MSFRNLTLVAVLAAASSTGACAPGVASALIDDEPGAQQNSMIHVENNNWSDMTIYVVRHGMRARIGQVGSMSAESFRIPAGMIGGAGDVTIIARPLASRDAYRTDRIMVVPGQRIDLRLENNINLSNYAVW